MLADVIPKIAEQKMLDEGSTGYSKYSPRPSSAGPDRCIRSMVYHAMGVPPKPLPGRSLLVFDDSSWHEELTKQWVAQSAFKLHSEQMGITLKGVMPWRIPGLARTCKVCGQVSGPDDLHGHLDFMVTDLAQRDWLVEHKAINHFTFNRMWEKADWPLDYLTQMGIYFRGLRAVHNDISNGLLLIKNKNTAQYIEFEAVYDHEADSIKIIRGVRSDGETYPADFTLQNVTKGAIEKFRLIEDVYLKNKTLPPRPFLFSDKDGFPCSYCAWSETCWLGYEEELAARGVGANILEIFEDCVRYRKLTDQETAAKKEKEEIKGRVKHVLVERNLKEAHTLGHIVTLELKKKKGFVVPASEYEQLNIKAMTYGRKEDAHDRRKSAARFPKD